MASPSLMLGPCLFPHQITVTLLKMLFHDYMFDRNYPLHPLHSQWLAEREPPPRLPGQVREEGIPNWKHHCRPSRHLEHPSLDPNSNPNWDPNIPSVNRAVDVKPLCPSGINTSGINKEWIGLLPESIPKAIPVNSLPLTIHPHAPTRISVHVATKEAVHLSFKPCWQILYISNCDTWTWNTPVLSLGAARAAAVASSSPAPPAAHRSHLRQQTIMINVINCEYRNEAHRLCPLLMGQTCSIYQLFKHGSNLSASSHSAV
eukprot:563910-Pelagomonas_calceolata.AAC.2